MKKNYRLMFYIFLAMMCMSAALFVLAGCSPKTSSKVVVQAPVAVPSAPLLLMREDKDILGKGVEMELIIYKTVEEATTRVLKGEADFTILPVNVAAKLYNKGVAVSLTNISSWGLLYLITDDQAIGKLADVKGRELYVGARGATPDIITRYLLSKNGLREGDVNLKYAQSPEIAQMLIKGLARSAVLPEPMITQVLEKKPGMRVVSDFFKEWQLVEGGEASLPQTGMIVGNEFMDKNPGVYRTFQEAYGRYLSEVVSSPEKAAPLVEKELGFPQTVFAGSIERSRLKYTDAASARGDVTTYLARLNDFSADMVGGKVPDEKFFAPK